MTVGGFGYYNGKSDWMINMGVRKPGSIKFLGINMGGNKEGFYMYGQTVVQFNSPTAVPQTTTNYGGNGISEHDLARLGNKSKSLSDIYYTKLTASSDKYVGIPTSKVWPTINKGGFVDKADFYDYMLDHAINTPVEVGALALRKNEQTKYFVLPWNNNDRTHTRFTTNLRACLNFLYHHSDGSNQNPRFA